jgi:hypothetical protein
MDTFERSGLLVYDSGGFHGSNNFVFLSVMRPWLHTETTATPKLATEVTSEALVTTHNVTNQNATI